MMFREMNGVQCENHTKHKYTVWETRKMFKYSKRNTQLPFGFKCSICCVHSASRNVHHALEILKKKLVWNFRRRTWEGRT